MVLLVLIVLNVLTVLLGNAKGAGLPGSVAEKRSQIEMKPKAKPSNQGAADNAVLSIPWAPV